LFVCLSTILCALVLASRGIYLSLGRIELSGGSAVHISAGFTTLAGTLALGRRKRHHELESPANISYIYIYILQGVGVLWFGWFGFNSGTALGANKATIMIFTTKYLRSWDALLLVQ